MPDGRPLYQQQLSLLAKACANAPAIYISLAQDSQPPPPTYPHRWNKTHPTANITAHVLPPKRPKLKTQVLVLQDLPHNPSPSSSQSAGPTTGASWKHLCERYQPPVTCFRNGDGFLEPLVAVWGPQALARMAALASEGKQREGTGVRPAGIASDVGARIIIIDEVGWNDGAGREWCGTVWRG
ncbi:hypothetical protein N657DRAFT_684782 [Parathielavia appendiculata]|uniref:Uncharacterized protein n=1 Tax=Parathielavia appendiculata TaxID=2587402 RepID=A0AAN6TRJ7_9PEZI|nr:hypothetical protein N657DRAFT_684782 [Parathielavia appendiculata]